MSFSVCYILHKEFVSKSDTTDGSDPVITQSYGEGEQSNISVCYIDIINPGLKGDKVTNTQQIIAAFQQDRYVLIDAVMTNISGLIITSLFMYLLKRFFRQISLSQQEYQEYEEGDNFKIDDNSSYVIDPMLNPKKSRAINNVFQSSEISQQQSNMLQSSQITYFRPDGSSSSNNKAKQTQQNQNQNFNKSCRLPDQQIQQNSNINNKQFKKQKKNSYNYINEIQTPTMGIKRDLSQNTYDEIKIEYEQDENQQLRLKGENIQQVSISNSEYENFQTLLNGEESQMNIEKQKMKKQVKKANLKISDSQQQESNSTNVSSCQNKNNKK
ncbi:hypothetical protein PPERSA_05586 [Pseudocohnilembus persalinus]|uniref:Transmembrane protein n=1 Tax=Pseudocohnilembus persalinus TaxID=266149 RepID=A0A0V0Q7L8_PSEPJ|nr:hypothetical protein PPERSA_05586 [Pseudocohnilembus persalinus]|eukprot:KRW98242.1 hypothetical protein PPERSA_05586 [Pseudocohnilembus persalinus]